MPSQPSAAPQAGSATKPEPGASGAGGRAPPGRHVTRAAHVTGGPGARTGAAGGAGCDGGAEELGEPGPGGAAWQVERRAGGGPLRGGCGGRAPAPSGGRGLAGALATPAPRTPHAGISRVSCGKLPQGCGELRRGRPRPAADETRPPPHRRGPSRRAS